MINYNESRSFLEKLRAIIRQEIEKHPSVKSSIKAQKAIVDSVNTTAKTVTVRFPLDQTPITLPYNPQMENYLTVGSVKGKTVSVWYYQSISNGIVMQNGNWSI